MIELPSTKIDKKAIKAWRISSVFNGLLLFIIPGFLYFMYFMGDLAVLFPIVAAPVTVVIYSLIITIYPKVRWSRWTYDVTEQG
ncbi:MAG: hypothetical protein BalsKO_02190 [Balneolaceae bacterium]